MSDNWIHIKKSDFIDIDKLLPIKGKDIEYISSDGSKGFSFRCNCHSSNCLKWRCTITGYELLIDVVKWKYIE